MSIAMDRACAEEIIPARPTPPKDTPTLAGMLLRPGGISNLIASYPAFWYKARYCDFRVGFSSNGRGILVNEPEAIRKILVSEAEHFPKEENQLAILKPLLGNGLLTTEGQVWRRNRKLAAPIFQHSSIKDFAPLFVRAAERSVSLSLENSGPFSIDKEMTRLTLQIIGEAVLDADLDDSAESISDAVTRTLDKFPIIFLATAFLPNKVRNRVVEAIVSPTRRQLDPYARSIVAQAERQESETTLIARLMGAAKREDGEGLTATQVRDEVATFLLAGHETTATTMSWAWYLLTLHPEWQERLHDEVRDVAGERPLTAEDVPSLLLTRAVIDETLRLYPVVANLMRRADKEVQLLDDLTVPAGTTVLVSPWLLHRHERHWREPHRFDPTRFMGEEAANRPRHTYLPFGGGPRICIGAGFAIMEAVLILATYMQKTRVRVLNADRVMPQARIVLRPNTSLQAVVTPRQPDIRR
ncbi:MAG: cytochrome P450 [Parvibaculaceae bacterium]|nr:cytochrome P450 [Parvibaculaceae bacterium]